jgi:PPM family protein phosphatase
MFSLKKRFQPLKFGAPSQEDGFELVAFGATDPGVRRDANEDSFLLYHPHGAADSLRDSEVDCLLAVADGLGRDERGKLASQMAVDVLCQSFFLPSQQPPMQRLVSGFEIANRRIVNQAEYDRSLQGMATTLTAVYVKDDTAYIAHVGNSRAYLIRGGKISRLTKDQTLAQVLIETGGANRHEISKSAHKTLLQAVGKEPFAGVCQRSVDLAPGDLLLLCSDGLTAHLTETEIRRVIEQNAAEPEFAVRRLVSEANERGGEDNITAIVAQYRRLARQSVSLKLATRVEPPPQVFRAAA